MFNLNSFKQKSPQQRFLFILGLVMFLIYLTLGVVLIFFKELIPIQMEAKYRIIFALGLIAYALIRFYRLINQKDSIE
jgi:uncharacterized membrane protein (DUF485 family)